MELVQAVGDVGVVFEHAGVLRLSRPPGAEEPSLRGRERPEEELGAALGCVDEVRSLQATAGLGECRDGEPIPRRDRLVVAQRLWPSLALGEQSRAGLVVELAAQ